MTKRSTTTRERARQQQRRTQAACHICGQPIDYTLPYLHPRQHVTDHITPLQLGGSDTLANMAAAHRDCNAHKAALPTTPTIHRSGSLH